MRILRLTREPGDKRTGAFTSGIVSMVGARTIALLFTGWQHAGEIIAEVLKTAGQAGCWLRDLLMPWALEDFANSEAQGWLYRYHLEWNERVGGDGGGGCIQGRADDNAAANRG